MILRFQSSGIPTNVSPAGLHNSLFFVTCKKTPCHRSLQCYSLDSVFCSCCIPTFLIVPWIPCTGTLEYNQFFCWRLQGLKYEHPVLKAVFSGVEVCILLCTSNVQSPPHIFVCDGFDVCVLGSTKKTISEMSIGFCSRKYFFVFILIIHNNCRWKR